MEIRAALHSDIPAIVDLLKVSLGETRLPKSEEYWRWKHIENPFGESPVLIAIDKGTIVGIRAFMRWEWTDGTNFYSSLRAVDTATHPDYQGKGIFKKLTFALVKECTEQKDHFVFNTPNSQSKPGYLKMGWEEAGKLPVQFHIHRPGKMLMGLFGNKVKQDVEISEALSVKLLLDHPGLPQLLINQSRGFGRKLRTNISANYLSWRYRQVPVVSYIGLGIGEKDELNGILIGRFKSNKRARELRITDLFLSDIRHLKELTSVLREKTKQLNIDYMTVSGTLPFSMDRSSMKFFKFKLGPVVTVRPLSDQVTMLKNFKNWTPSLGDLELF